MRQKQKRTRPSKTQEGWPGGPPAAGFAAARLVPCLLFAVAVLAYLPAAGGDWLYDDKYAILKNPLLRDWGGLPRIWTTFGQIPLESHYWPMTYTLLWAEWQSWGARPIGFHLVNFALHGLIVVQVWRLGRRLGLPGAALGAALFALHPVHVEAVAWIISVKDLLAASFCLLAVELAMNFEERGWKWLVLAAAAAAAATLSKASPVMLPAALGLLAWYRRGALRGRDWAAVGAVAAVTFTLAGLDVWLGWRHNWHPPAPPWADRVVQSGRAFWFYLEKLVWPARLNTIYPQWGLKAGRPADWLPLIAIAPATWALWAARRRIGRGPLACWLLYGVTLGPVLGIVHFDFLLRSPAADRYQYLASLGPLVGAGALAGGWIERRAAAARTWGRAAAALVLALLALLTARQAAVYRSEESLFRYAHRYAPDSSFVAYNLGVALMDKGRYAEAETWFADAVRLEPDNWMAVANWGGMLIAQKKYAAAVAVYGRAVEGGCTEPLVYCNLTFLLSTSSDPAVRRPAEALRVANLAVRKFGANDPKYLSVLATAESANGHVAEAVANARRALRLAQERNDAALVKKLQMLLPMFEKGQTPSM